MAFKRITLALEDGLTANFAPLSDKVASKLRKKQPREFALLEYRAPLDHLYVATLKSGRMMLKTLCFSQKLPQIIKMLATETPAQMLDLGCTEGFLVGDQLIISEFNKSYDKMLSLLKTAMTERFPLEIAPLLLEGRT